MTDGNAAGKQNRRQFASLVKIKSGWGYPPQGVLALGGDHLAFVEGMGRSISIRRSIGASSRFRGPQRVCPS